MNLKNSFSSTKKRILQVVILLFLILSVSFIAIHQYKETLQETGQDINNKIIAFHLETFQELSKIFLKDTKNHFIQNVVSNKNLRATFEDMLRLVRISTVQNLFVVARDKEKNYYFLLDSELDKTKHANLYEPFTPLGNYWQQVYILKKPQIFHHHDDTNLWITIVYPIIQNNQTIAIIAADISYELHVSMQKQLKSFTIFFFWILLLVILVMAFFYILILYFRRKYYEGYIDPLTNVYNRKYLYDILLKKLAREYQLFMIDIDFFKKVNDNYGHDAGDYILQEVAIRLKSLTRDEDSIIRYGGEEFLIYTTNLNAKQCYEFAERLRKYVKKDPIIYKHISCTVSISVGCYSQGSKFQAFNDIFKKADEALYEAKLSGRDCVQIYE
ncbi:GGDEF domain-containing protein [Sulfurimonas sp.]